jgi:hypothetical protein
LLAVPLAPTPLVVTNQPADLVSSETRTVFFTAGVRGSHARFQWFKDGVEVPGATSSTLVLSNLSRADAGSYALRATNVFGAVFSRIAMLTVVADGERPYLLAADQVAPGRVTALFSEPVDASVATNASAYVISNTLGGTFTVFSASLTNATNLTLVTESLPAEVNLVLFAHGIRDTAPAQNTAAVTGAAPNGHALQRRVAVLRPIPAVRRPRPGRDLGGLGTRYFCVG